MKKTKEQRFYFSDKSQHTLDAWTGGGSYFYLWEVELFGFKIVLWRTAT